MPPEGYYERLKADAEFISGIYQELIDVGMPMDLMVAPSLIASINECGEK